MNITVNGEPQTVAEGLSVRELIQERTSLAITAEGTAQDGGRLGLAVAVGENVVPRSAWNSRILAEGDDVEIVTAVQGG